MGNAVLKIQCGRWNAKTQLGVDYYNPNSKTGHVGFTTSLMLPFLFTVVHAKFSFNNDG